MTGRGFSWFAVTLALAIVAMPTVRTAAQVGRALPEEAPFFDETRQNVERAQRAQFQFAYKERRTELRTNPFGRIGTGETRAYAVTPAPDGSSLVRQLIERDGVPVEDGDTERIDLARRRRRPSGRERRSSMDDAAAMLQFAMDRREQLHGRDHIVVRFWPRQGVTAETREGRLAQAFEGLIWIDEEAREIVRVEATALDSISFGWGLVARLSKGSSARLERARVEANLWMPTSLEFSGEGRAFLFLRRLAVNHRVEWFDYRRIREGPVE